MQAPFMESVSRRTYWVGVGGLIVALIVPSAMLGLYDVGDEQAVDPGSAGIRPSDPLTAFLMTPFGRLVMLLLAQYLVANVVFWFAVWVRYRWVMRVRRSS